MAIKVISLLNTDIPTLPQLEVCIERLQKDVDLLTKLPNKREDPESLRVSLEFLKRLASEHGAKLRKKGDGNA